MRIGLLAWLATFFVAVVPAASAAEPMMDRTLAAVVPASMNPSPVSTFEAVPRAVTPVATREIGVPYPDGAAAAECHWPDRQVLAAILPVATDSGSHASGVVFAEGRVLTAAHAVQGASRFFVRIGADFRKAELLLVDHDADLAVLGIDTQGIVPLPLASSDLDDSQPVWAAGYPRARAMSTSAGVVQRNRGGALHTSASIDSGQSGGGLLGCQRGAYHLAGMLRGYGAYLSGDRYVKLENHSVSVAATTIQRFLNAYR